MNLKRKFKKYLWTLSVETFDNRRGVPDVIMCLNGHFVALEFKRSANEMHHDRTRLQEYVAQKIKSAQGLHFFIYPENEKECYDELKTLL